MSFELEMIHEAVAGIPCSRCGAPPNNPCVNPITKLAAKIPCLARIIALDAGESDAA